MLSKCSCGLCYRNNPLITLGKAEATIVSATDVILSHQRVFLVLRTLEYSQEDNSSGSSTATFQRIATSAFLELCDRNEV